MHDGHISARERLERIRDAYAVGTYLGKSGLTLDLLYRRLFVATEWMDADEYVREHGDPLEWGVFPAGSEIYMTKGWGQFLLLQYPDQTWHWHDSGAEYEDGRVPTADEESAEGVAGVLREIDDMLHPDPLFTYSGGFVDKDLQASLAPVRT